jgi:YesN/AraC family two-component response regulator
MVNENNNDKDWFDEYYNLLVACVQEGDIEDARRLVNIISEKFQSRDIGTEFINSYGYLKKLVEHFIDPHLISTIRINLTTDIPSFFEYEGHPGKLLSLIFFKYLLVLQQSVKKQENSQQYKMVIKAIDIVERDYADSNFSLKKVAEKLFVSYGHLCSVFKRITGVPFKEYLIDFRMRKACELLKQGDLEIQQIAKITGYSSSRYFNMAFNKYFGLSPSAYAKYDMI